MPGRRQFIGTAGRAALGLALLPPHFAWESSTQSRSKSFYSALQKCPYSASTELPAFQGSSTRESLLGNYWQLYLEPFKPNQAGDIKSMLASFLSRPPVTWNDSLDYAFACTIACSQPALLESKFTLQASWLDFCSFICERSFEIERFASKGDVLDPFDFELLKMALLPVHSDPGLWSGNHQLRREASRARHAVARLCEMTKAKNENPAKLPGEWQAFSGPLFARAAGLDAHFMWVLANAACAVPAHAMQDWVFSSKNPYYSSGSVVSGLVRAGNSLDSLDTPSLILEGFEMRHEAQLENRIRFLQRRQQTYTMPRSIHRDGQMDEQPAGEALSYRLFLALVLHTERHFPHLFFEKPV